MVDDDDGARSRRDPSRGAAPSRERMPLAELVRTSRAVEAADGRNEKVARLAGLLDRIDPGRAPVAAAWLSGELPHDPIGVGPATLDDVEPAPAPDEPSLALAEVDERLRSVGEISGAGARDRKLDALEELFGRATAEERDFLGRLILGELRQGAGEGLMQAALAEAAGAELETVRRAAMLAGELGPVVRAGLEGGPEALRAVSLELFRPVRPMLAHTADDLGDALDRLGRMAVERKLDGVRVQIHKSGGDVRIFTRRRNEVTGAVPELVEAGRAVDADAAVLDGEALALDADGRPRPFQETMRRFGRVGDVEEIRREVPLSPFFFDVLRLGEEVLLERPAGERFERLATAVEPARIVPRTVTDDRREAERFLAETLSAGHEGVLAKDLDAPYRAGSRGQAWLKVKPARTADLVVLAAEWGHGRREGWLSNLHLGARDPEGRAEGGPYPEGWAMVGKTFKGMTDEMLERQTDSLLELELRREGRTVHVRPEAVVEVAFDELQESPTYRAGVALRFARVLRHRSDLDPADADTLDRLRELDARG